MAPILDQSVGYAVVIGIGFFFSGLMMLLTSIQRRYTVHQTTSATEFMSASHSVGPGLIGSGIVSAWTWAATLLQSSSVAYKFGIAGPWWYGAGATVQIILFAQNAAKLKMNAPHAHTFLEVIKVRWGKVAHLTFMVFGLGANILVSAMLVTGGSSTVYELTGMPVQAACMLIPVGVVLYVIVGGLRATLVADYIHTTFLFSVILTLMFTVFTISDKIGSPSKMYDLLVLAAERAPVAGNAGGSYLTLRSKSGLIFGILNLCTCFSTVYLDQAYWQRVCASESKTCVKAFILGGTAWFSIPLGFATTMGLTAVALATDPSFPGYPVPLTVAQVAAGLPAPAAASAILGKTGAILMLVVLFLAVVSSASAELVAVSSIITFDIYRPYINPHATEKQILFVDAVAIGAYGIFLGVLGLIFFYLNISLGWLYSFTGVTLGGAVVPVALAIITSRANKWGCIIGAWFGMAAGLVSWLSVAGALNNGVINVETTYQDYAMLAGSLSSICSGALIATISSYIWPENYDFAETRALNAPSPSVVMEVESEGGDGAEKKPTSPDGVDLESAQPTESSTASINIAEPIDFEGLTRDFNFARKFSLGMVLLLCILIPLPLFFSSHIYTRQGFVAWIAVAFCTVFYGAFTTVVYPIWESRGPLKTIGVAIARDVGRIRTAKVQ